MTATLAERVRMLAGQELRREVKGVEPLAAGLGLRRFFRVRLCGGEPASVVARVELGDDPLRRAAGLPPEPPLEPVRRFLEEHGLPVPLRYGGDTDIDLLEDVGDGSLRDEIRRADALTRRALYAEACAWLPRLQSLTGDPGRLPCFGRRLDERYFAFKADRILAVGLPTLLGRPATAAEESCVQRGLEAIAAVSLAAPARLAHRDYKAANLHLRPGTVQGGRLVWIDLQGALLAPPEYDLVCLLHDAEVGLEEAEVEEQLQRVRPSLPDGPAPETCERRFQLLSLSRVGKDLSLFLGAAQGGDARYLEHVPRAGRILTRSAARAAAIEPSLRDLCDVLGGLGERACVR